VNYNMLLRQGQTGNPFARKYATQLRFGSRSGRHHSSPRAISFYHLVSACEPREGPLDTRSTSTRPSLGYYPHWV